MTKGDSEIKINKEKENKKKEIFSSMKESHKNVTFTASMTILTFHHTQKKILIIKID